MDLYPKILRDDNQSAITFYGVIKQEYKNKYRLL